MNTDKTTSSTRPPIAAEIMRMSKPWEIPLSSSPSVLPCTAEVGTSGKGKGVCRFLLGAEGLRTNVEGGVKLLDDMVALQKLQAFGHMLLIFLL